MVLDIPNAGLARAVLPQQIIVQIAREILTATASLRHGTLLVHLYAAPAHPRAGVGDSQGSVRERGVGCVQASPLAPRGIAFGNFRFQLCAGATRWIRKLRSRNSPDSKIPIGDRTSAKCDSPAGEGEGAAMTPATTFAGRSVALFGLGGSGLATALALKAGGARVIACDDSGAAMAQAQGQGIETGDLKSADWSRFAALVLAPGVSLTHPEPHWSVRLARGAGVEIIGDIELFCREREKLAPQAPFVAITGTNGKSTTTSLIAHILREAGRDVQM